MMLLGGSDMVMESLKLRDTSVIVQGFSHTKRCCLDSCHGFEQRTLHGMGGPSIVLPSKLFSVLGHDAPCPSIVSASWW